MSDNYSEEDEFKLPLRPWLKSHIDKKTFPGLEWIDEKKQIFKIPWTKKGHPNWERDYEVFKCWARHRGRLDDKCLDYNKLKGNFRSVLHKSEDFREIKEYNISNQQTGNYKVYQILPSFAVKENRKRQHSKSNEPTSSTSTLLPKQKKSSRSIKTAPVEIDKHEEVLVTSDQLIPVTITSNQIDEDLFHSLQNSLVEEIPQATFCNSNVIHSTQPEYTCAVIEEEAFPNILEQDFGQLLSTEIIDMLEPSIKTSFVSPAQESCDSATTISKFFENSEFTKNDIQKCYITISYGGKIVNCQHLVNLSQGLRLMYGDPEMQRSAVVANGKKVEDMDLQALKMPEYQLHNSRIAESLKMAEQGVVLFASDQGDFYAKRLCQSRVWLIIDKNKFERMERKKTLLIFSFANYVQAVLEGQGQSFDYQVEMTIGEKPSSPLVNLVKITIQPIMAPHIENFINDIKGNSSLCYSNEPSSVDNMIRLFTVQSLDK